MIEGLFIPFFLKGEGGNNRRKVERCQY